MASRDKDGYFAKLAEQAERYDEMASYVRAVCKLPDELAVEEQNLLSVAYKNAVGSSRAAWRIITSVENKEKSKGNEEQSKIAKEYCVKVEGELQKICDTILGVLETSSSSSKVGYSSAPNCGRPFRPVTQLAGGRAVVMSPSLPGRSVQ